MTASAILASGAAFALPALSLFLPSGYSWGALLLLVLGLRAWRTWLQPRQLPLELATWALVVALGAGVWIMHLLENQVLETRTLGLDRPIKYGLALLAIPALLTPARWPLALATGCWAGAGLAGIMAIWDVAHLNLPRAEGHTNAIHFGNIALLLAAWAALWALQQGQPPGSGVEGFSGVPEQRIQTRPIKAQSHVWGWAACGMGLLALVLSGSRGGWMALPVLGALVVWQWRNNRGASGPDAVGGNTGVRLSGVFLSGLLSLVLVFSLPSVRERIEQAQAEWKGWVQTGESNNSVGQRLAHWQFGWRMFLERPLTGWGQAAYDAQRLQAIDGGTAPEPLRHFNHAHNEWVDMAAKRGLVGLAVLVALYAVPGWLYVRRLRRTINPATRTLALCGLATVLGYVVFGLTQVMFAHNSGNMVYLFMNTLWLGALAQQPPDDRLD